MMNDVTLATSRYQNRGAIIASGHVPVRTTLGPPRFKLGYQLGANLRIIAPTRTIFAIEDPVAFDAAYRKHLDSVGVVEISRQLAEVSGAHENKGLVLLCFEDVHQLGEFACHRRAFARWWEAQTGQQIHELSQQSQPDAQSLSTI